MRKPACLAVIAISIVVAGVSLGVTLTRYLGLRAYAPKGSAQAAAIPAGRNVPATPPERWNNPFAPADGMKLASRLPAVTGKTASAAPRTAYVLLGTIVSSSPAARRAILWADGMKQPKAFREKEEVEPGAFLSSIERDRVWVARGTEREKLEMLPVGSRSRTASKAAAPTVPVPSAAPSVGGAPSLSAFPTDASTLPRVAPATRTAPVRTPAAAASRKSSEDDEGEKQLTPRQQRRRDRGLRR